MSRSKSAAALAVTVTLLCFAAACSGSDPAAPETDSSTLSPPSSSASSAEPAPEPSETTTPPPPQPSVTLADCYDIDSNDLPTFTIHNIADPGAELAKIWPKEISDCDTMKRSKGELTTREKAALAAAHYKKGDLTYLYLYCAENDPDDYFNKKSASASSEQIPELRGQLIMCPRHPQARAWKAAIRRGDKQAKLERTGRSFYSGTYRVGKEIKPGTYAVTGDIENCYWERQNRAGRTIDNDFIPSARRVEVTIRSTDYAFSSEGCGQWKPAK